MKSRACLICGDVFPDRNDVIKAHFSSKHPTIYYSIAIDLIAEFLKALTIPENP